MERTYPRTIHFPWSPSRDRDDLILQSCESFVGREVVILEKVDGENTTMTRDEIATRSGGYVRHPSRSRMSALHASVAREIPRDFRIVGENVYARHSIFYERLQAYFLVFGIFDDATGEALAWDEVADFLELMCLSTVPVLWRGMWDEKFMREGSFWKPNCGEKSEGYVVRIAERFPSAEFAKSVAKFRAFNTTTTSNFMRQEVVPNRLAESSAY